MSESRVYVGNLPFSIGFEELKELFSPCGEVTEATVIVNKFSGRSKGFGFVTFTNAESAEKAIAEMNEKEVGGRRISVRPAKPMEERSEGDRDRERPRRFDREDRY
ncbi:MAG: RNA-binding protein [Nanoarchaeota archaeon]